MQRELPIKTRNTLTKVECIIRRVPEQYRKDLCTSVTNMLKNPLDSHFQASDFCIIDPFHKIRELYNHLCDTEKDAFVTAFPDVAKQFEIC